MNCTKQCWACGKVTMVAKGNYFQCSECGATWNKMPEMGSYMDVAPKRDIVTEVTSFTPVRKQRFPKPHPKKIKTPKMSTGGRV